MEELEKEEVYDEAKAFMEEIKGLIYEVRKQGKKVVYASSELLIFSLEEETNTIYEVLDRNKVGFASRLVYIGDKKVASSYLLNLIHKQELKIDPYTEKHY